MLPQDLTIDQTNQTKRIVKLIILMSLSSFYHFNSVNGGAVGEPIRFGQNFGLGTTGGFSDQMVRQ